MLNRKENNGVIVLRKSAVMSLNGSQRLFDKRSLFLFRADGCFRRGVIKVVESK